MTRATAQINKSKVKTRTATDFFVSIIQNPDIRQQYSHRVRNLVNAAQEEGTKPEQLVSLINDELYHLKIYRTAGRLQIPIPDTTSYKLLPMAGIYASNKTAQAAALVASAANEAIKRREGSSISLHMYLDTSAVLALAKSDGTSPRKLLKIINSWLTAKPAIGTAQRKYKLILTKEESTSAENAPSWKFELVITSFKKSEPCSCYECLKYNATHTPC
jgi:type II secretory pathway pseudopilin PulG